MSPAGLFQLARSLVAVGVVVELEVAVEVVVDLEVEVEVVVEL